LLHAQLPKLSSGSELAGSEECQADAIECYRPEASIGSIAVPEMASIPVVLAVWAHAALFEAGCYFMSESIGEPDRTLRIEFALEVFGMPVSRIIRFECPATRARMLARTTRSTLFRPECMRDRLDAEADASVNLADATPRAAVSLLPAREMSINR
jgi:hypothetical protein